MANLDDKQRREVDATLGVTGWSVDGTPPRAREWGVPDWWEGPEEASQSFLQAMGVQL